MFTLQELLKSNIIIAMRERNERKRDILKVALGEIQTIEGRTGKPLSHDEALKVLRKIVANNDEAIAATKDVAMQQKLSNENVILSTFLPRQATPKEIEDALEGTDLISAKSDGQAVGVALKVLKAKGINADGAVVLGVVKQIRTATVA